MTKSALAVRRLEALASRASAPPPAPTLPCDCLPKLAFFSSLAERDRADAILCRIHGRRFQSYAILPKRGYTEEEWNHFVVTRKLLLRNGLAAAQAWLLAHPRPRHVPHWILESEAEARQQFSPNLPPIPSLAPDSEVPCADGRLEL